YGLAEILDGLVVFHLPVGLSSVDVTLSKCRIKLNGFVVIFDRILVLLQLHKSISPVRVGVYVLWAELDGPRKIPDGIVEVAFSKVTEAQVIVRLRILRILSNHVIEARDDEIVVLLLQRLDADFENVLVGSSRRAS